MICLIERKAAVLLIIMCLLLVPARRGDAEMVPASDCKPSKCDLCRDPISGERSADAVEAAMVLQDTQTVLDAWKEVSSEFGTKNPPSSIVDAKTRVRNRLDMQNESEFVKLYKLKCPGPTDGVLGHFDRSSGEITIDKCLCKTFCSEIVWSYILHELNHALYSSSPDSASTLATADALRQDSGGEAAADTMLAKWLTKGEINAYSSEVKYLTDLLALKRDCTSTKKKVIPGALPGTFYERIKILVSRVVSNVFQ